MLPSTFPVSTPPRLYIRVGLHHRRPDDMSDADPSPPTAAYFELSWAILSTIGITNLFFSFIVIGLVGFTPISLVPIIVSVAGAIANGLCYYAFYAGYPEINTAVASAFADMAWLVGSFPRTAVS